MEITLEEFKALKAFYCGKPVDVSKAVVSVLFDKKLIKYKGYTSSSTSYSYELIITNEGKLVYENYRNNRISVRRANIQSWIAIAISACSLVVSLISMLSKL